MIISLSHYLLYRMVIGGWFFLSVTKLLCMTWNRQYFQSFSSFVVGISTARYIELSWWLTCNINNIFTVIFTASFSECKFYCDQQQDYSNDKWIKKITICGLSLSNQGDTTSTVYRKATSYRPDLWQRGKRYTCDGSNSDQRPVGTLRSGLRQIVNPPIAA